MSIVAPILAHIMGLPVEETVLFGLPPITAAFSAWWVQHRARRTAPARGEAGSDVHPSARRTTP